jgi:hypothetical protein
MDCPSLFSQPYLIRSECGKEYNLFSARWLSIKDDTFVDHTLYLTPDGTYLYSTCNVFRDSSSPETYRVLEAKDAKAIFQPYLSPQQQVEYFP